MTQPAVSVVIPVFNRARLVLRAIGSVLAQTFEDFELVVVDDASTDGLAGALALIRHPALRIIRHADRRGAGAARNTGVSASRGNLVAFLDSDDTWAPQKLERQLAAMRDLPTRVAGHVCGYNLHREGYSVCSVVPLKTGEPLFRNLLFGCYLGSGTTLLCRREMFSEVGPFCEEIRRLEDWEWLLRLAESRYELVGSSEILADVYFTPSSNRMAIEAALGFIAERHLAAINRRSRIAGRIIRSSFDLERAAIELGEQRLLKALGHVWRALASYPFRNARFYNRMLQHMLHVGRRDFFGNRAVEPGRK